MPLRGSGGARKARRRLPDDRNALAVRCTEEDHRQRRMLGCILNRSRRFLNTPSKGPCKIKSILHPGPLLVWWVANSRLFKPPAQIHHRNSPRPPIWDASALSLAVARCRSTRSKELFCPGRTLVRLGQKSDALTPRCAQSAGSRPARSVPIGDRSSYSCTSPKGGRAIPAADASLMPVSFSLLDLCPACL